MTTKINKWKLQSTVCTKDAVQEMFLMGLNGKGKVMKAQDYCVE